MIVVTGAAGFIGSVVIGYLNSLGIDDIWAFDNMPNPEQFKNLVGKKIARLSSADTIPAGHYQIRCVVHIGANSSTLEKDWASIYETNVQSTRDWYEFCVKHAIPMIFTSSAAVYGNGHGPLNQYAFSKQLSENEMPLAVKLRLFNVYGPNEYHKGRMASTIYHWYEQLQKTGTVSLFNNSEEFRRDFIHVEDVAKVIHHFIDNHQPGTYDVGSGTSTSFEQLADTLLHNVEGTKEHIDMPEDLREQYQKHTCADVTALRLSGFDLDRIQHITVGMHRYVEYLKTRKFY